jgi:hypothetical protein
MGGLLDESLEHFVNDVFKIGEKAIDRRRETRSIEPTAQPHNRVSKLSFNGANAVDVLVVAVEEPTHHLRRLVLSCSPRVRWGEHVELFEKLEGKVLKQR